jgi:hypothetical protein
MNGKTIDDILKANKNAPTNDEYALNFARKLLPHRDQRTEERLDLSFSEGPIALAADELETGEWCGEYTLGLLDAVLVSTLISSDAKTEIEAMLTDSMPALEKDKTIGHFRFKWTETSADSRDNVSEANIDATGVILNDCWNRYTTDFRQPKADLIGGQRIIDVDVYFNGWLFGSTSSHTNKIFLNSLYVVSDDCRRQTTTVHELFHRVQYSYGYVTGTGGQTWWVEGTASWSQDYYRDNINDYVTRVNDGLAIPDKNLLNRSYDACHYWKYFAEQIDNRSTPVISEEQAMQEFLNEYSTNGLNAKGASGTITQNRISRTFDRFFQDWSKANIIKDLDNPSIRYEYEEDEDTTTICSRTYGPYSQVNPVENITIDSNNFAWTSPTHAVDSYGTDYLIAHIRPTVSKANIRFEGNPASITGQFSLHLILIKDNRWKMIYNNYSGVTERTWDLSFEAGKFDRCVLVVNGLATGGKYEISINACVSGVWKDNYNYVWTLVQTGNDITGTVQTTTCGTYKVKGKITENKITLKATGKCCDFEFKGKIVDCKTGSGSWTNDCGGKGSWKASKTDATEAMAALEMEELEIADDPTTMRT